ncbi:bacillithiol biosynthesis cysteine-adding enzyme BshC [Robertkochia sediminum]|uniref:bacillithiol biosynthesis cysteine-adding enzyme BshC n=1 Tax=Robertkochia sediminum TaxID=2785326 RepID=UPI00193221C9|nr:bacillithiol biosynthesis cysteine-adding enzyme BshC [Robertkochia sediminum]MBL7472696.1 bacillithiol biosynthesis cysteine-adding enzyme BshC [Robertkochia sediminum]
MTLETIDLEKTGRFSALIRDYLAKKPSLTSFYNRFPELEAFKGQIEEKSSFSVAAREVLADALEGQYEGLDVTESTKANIAALRSGKTFTITTGHQLNLFTGPVYFIYKIASVINLCKQLKQAYPQNDFVPVYWMATEDHDFDEINFFNYHGMKFQWQGSGDESMGGAVGKMNTRNLDKVADLFKAELGPGKFAETLHDLFCKAYLKHDDLTSATRYMVNTLFGDRGLVIVDGDDPKLKRQFIPHVKSDLLKQTAYKEVTKTIARLQEQSADYNIQVNPREINLFYLQMGSRERIVYDGGAYGLAEGEKQWDEKTLLEEVEAFPERFSPNVMLRPLYQEVILPNLCYIGGGGELAYWLELNGFFKASEVPMPILLLRDSVLVMSEKQKRKFEALGVSTEEMFLDNRALVNKKIREISDLRIDLSPERKLLTDQFQRLYSVAEHTDASFLGAVKAQEVKQIKGLDHLEKRLLKAQKRKMNDHVSRITTLQNTLFPGGGLQERSANFSLFYMEYGQDFFVQLFEELDPLDLRFKILTFSQTQ